MTHPKVPLARLPTPLEPLRQDPKLWIKRDDLTGCGLSGNKVRKLEYLLGEAEAQGADTLITCGATSSNHARATAVAAARRGLGCHLLLRGEAPAVPQGNLLLDKIVGAQCTYIPLEAWDDRLAHMNAIAAELEAEKKRPYVIPEGGSNPVGSLGYIQAGEELLEQIRSLPVQPRRIFHATGSGGTTAGLALGLAGTEIEVMGVAVCDDRRYFDRKIQAIIDETASSGLIDPERAAKARWTIVEGFKGDGYAKTNQASLEAIARFARTEGVFTDPVYTFKALAAFLEMAPNLDGDSIFWHTGGIFELFDFANQFAE